MKRGMTLILCLLLLGGCALAEGYEVLMDEGRDTLEENGVLIAELDAKFPQIIGMADTAVMDQVNHAIQDTIRLNGEYDGVCEAAEGDYAAGVHDFTAMHYSLTVRAEATRKTGVLLGVRYDFSAFTGGAHGNSWTQTEQFDLRTGETVYLEQMVSDENAFHDAVAAYILSDIGQRGLVAEMGYFDGYEDVVASWHTEQAVLSDGGLLVVFSAIDLGPYASGPQEFTIPYDVLATHWNQLGNTLIAG